MTTFTHTFKGSASRRKRKRVPVAGPGEGYTTVDDGVETADVQLALDVPAIIALLGRRAMESKSGRAKYLGGLILAVVPKIRS